MLHVHIITLGKLKENYWRDAETEYVKRLQSFVKLTIHELKEIGFSEKDNPTIIKEQEAKKITAELAKISDSYNIILGEHGKQFSSTEFSHQLGRLTVQQFNTFTFIIGGPLGHDDSILKLAHLKLSLSSLTFTHQMARVILLEQLYRAMMIKQTKPYHY